MANMAKGEVPILLDRSRTLYFDANALANLEDDSGYTIKQIFTEFANKDIPMKVLRGIVCAGLQHQSPGLTVDQAGELIQQAPGGTVFEKYTNLSEICIDALTRAMPRDDDAKKNMATVESGTGNDSSSSDSP